MNEIERLQQLAGIARQINEEEGPVDKVAVGHVDNESDMMRKQLYTMGVQTIKLYKMLSKLEDGDFPHWWQAKIVRAAEYIEAAYNYLDSELNSPEEDSVNVSDDAADYSDPSGVS